MKKPICIEQSFEAREFKPHFHEGYSIGLITGGEHRLHFREERSLIGPGEIKIVHPYELHCVDRSSSWSYVNLLVDAGDLWEVAGKGPDREKSGTMRFAHRITERSVIDGFVALCRVPRDSMAFEERYLEFLSLLLRRHAYRIVEGEREEGRIGRAVEWIEEHYKESPSLEEIARIAGRSKYHTIRLFKKHLGLTPHQYILRLRIEASVRALSGGSSLAEAAFECGFSDQSHFLKEFKKIYGVPPSRFLA